MFNDKVTLHINFPAIQSICEMFFSVTPTTDDWADHLNVSFNRIVSVDIFDGFETNFNVINWRGVDVVEYILILLFTLGMDTYIEKNKEKGEPT